jgi:predicted O-linked N-acetylglucosamine transferase (SPINDLY family)
MVPPEEKPQYTEEIRYLPSVVSYFSQKAFPPLSPLPALCGTGITFGSVNRLSKVTDMVWDTWVEILHAVPDSKLLVKAIEMDSVTNSDNVRAKFLQAGIAAERLILLGGSDWLTHLGTFSQIDICLDPFPHGGGVTTLEGLKMGVPVVTLNWPTLVGRLSASILTTLGLTDWVANSREDYVRLAADKARDLAALSQVRATLRERFDSSVIGDNAAYVAAVEAEYRQLWLRWCGRQTPDATAIQ